MTIRSGLQIIGKDNGRLFAIETDTIAKSIFCLIKLGNQK
jgi:hypothetical protein